jgi:hypothetical protein
MRDFRILGQTMIHSLSGVGGCGSKTKSFQWPGYASSRHIILEIAAKSGLVQDRYSFAFRGLGEFDAANGGREQR